MLLQIDTEIAYRQAAVRADWARSRPAPGRERAVRPPVLHALRSRAAQLLHA
jgi:hypothetical protein